MAFRFEFTALICLVFGSLFWLMIFLQTYMHFPKMEKQMRLKMSAGNATGLSLILIALVFVSLWLLSTVLGW